MNHLILIAVAGACGALARYALVSTIGARFFPWGTMTVNIIGSCLMGFAYVYIVERNFLPESLKPLIMTGFLGAFTTFSTFSLEAWQLIDKGELFNAAFYIIGTTVICIVALFAGVLLSRASL
jgi:CrcB protein